VRQWGAGVDTNIELASIKAVLSGGEPGSVSFPIN
jgi:hypothetical protein